jgi:hypothetical protein
LNIGKDQEIHEIAEKNNFLSWQGTKHKSEPPQAAAGAGIDRQDETVQEFSTNPKSFRDINAETEPI